MTPTVGDVLGWIEDAYPPALAESWDRIGLDCGDPAAAVGSVLLAVDLDDAVLDEAEASGAGLVITHHPLLLRGLHAVRTDEPKGRLLTRMIRGGVAHVAAHTNADAARDGVSDALADALGLVDVRPFVAAPSDPLDKLVTLVPEEHADGVRSALAEAGAGAIGDYEACSFTASGTGRFRPLAGADPFIGEVGRIEQVAEERIEMVLPRHRRRAVVEALHAAHPYEEPAFDVLELASLDSARGLGRIGRLVGPITAADLARRLAAALPETAGGVRLGGAPDRQVETVAVLGGAGDSMLDAARAAGVDCYVTSDLRHHPASEFLQWDAAPALIDISHWAAESLWLPRCAAMLAARAASENVTLSVAVSQVRTDPWTARF